LGENTYGGIQQIHQLSKKPDFQTACRSILSNAVEVRIKSESEHDFLFRIKYLIVKF